MGFSSRKNRTQVGSLGHRLIRKGFAPADHSSASRACCQGPGTRKEKVTLTTIQGTVSCQQATTVMADAKPQAENSKMPSLLKSPSALPGIITSTPILQTKKPRLGKMKVMHHPHMLELTAQGSL